MKKIFLICLSVVFLCSCATTEVLNVWQEKSAEGTKLTNILVIGVVKKDSYRKLFENSMVDQLNALGVKASAGYKLFPNIDYLEKDMIVDKINQLNIDGVIVAKLVEKSKETVTTPSTTYVSGGSYHSYPYATPYSHSSNYHGYYNNSYQVAYSPGHSVEYDISTVETNVYDAKTEGLIWSAITETAETGATRAITSYIGEISKQLDASKLF